MILKRLLNFKQNLKKKLKRKKFKIVATKFYPQLYVSEKIVLVCGNQTHDMCYSNYLS